MAKINRFDEFKIKIEINKFISEQLLKDKKSYTGHIPTEYNRGSSWNPITWIIDEIIQFLTNTYSTSYILREFGNKYDYDLISKILKELYPDEYKEAEQIFLDIY